MLLFLIIARKILQIRYYLPNVEIKACKIVVRGNNFFVRTVKNLSFTYDNFSKFMRGQGNNCATEA